jgi:hypothetical protein
LSISRYKVIPGLAQLIITGEPVFIKEIYEAVEGKPCAKVVRAVVTQNGIVHQDEVYPVAQLETRYSAAKRNLELRSFLEHLQEKEANKQYELSKAEQAALKANVSHASPEQNAVAAQRGR